MAASFLTSYLDAGVAVLLQVLMLNHHCYLSQPRDRFALTLPTPLPPSLDPCPFACKMDLLRRFERNCTAALDTDGRMPVTIKWSLLYPLDSSDTEVRTMTLDPLEPGCLYRRYDDETLVLKTRMPDEQPWITLLLSPSGEMQWVE